MAKVYVKRPNQKRPAPVNLSGEEEIIELELNGVVINRVKRSKEFAMMYADFFYNKHGAAGKVYFIRGSKMNFKSLMNGSDE